MPKPTKEDFLKRLKINIPITCVVDVGVREQTNELIQAFPEIKHYLFEPVAFFADQIAENYKQINYELFSFALSDENTSVYLILSSLEKNGVATHSHISDSPANVDGSYILSCLPIEVKRFEDTSVANKVSKDFLLKVDVDGKDLNVLTGFGDGLKSASAIIVECTANTMVERMQYVQAHGFTMMDMVDIVYYGDSLYQFDASFIRNDLITETIKPSFDPFRSELWQDLKF